MRGIDSKSMTAARRRGSARRRDTRREREHRVETPARFAQGRLQFGGRLGALRWSVTSVTMPSMRMPPPGCGVERVHSGSSGCRRPAPRCGSPSGTARRLLTIHALLVDRLVVCDHACRPEVAGVELAGKLAAQEQVDARARVGSVKPAVGEEHAETGPYARPPERRESAPGRPVRRIRACAQRAPCAVFV